MFFSHASFRSQAVGKEEVNNSSVVLFFSLTSTYIALFLACCIISFQGLTNKCLLLFFCIPYSAASHFQLINILSSRVHTCHVYIKTLYFSPAPEWPPLLHRLFLCSSWRLRSRERLIRASSRSYIQHSRANFYLNTPPLFSFLPFWH